MRSDERNLLQAIKDHQKGLPLLEECLTIEDENELIAKLKGKFIILSFDNILILLEN